MTPLLIAILRKELEPLLLSGKISHISQPAPEIVELSLYHPDRPVRFLVVALLPQKPMAFVSAQKRAALAKPPNFCRSLRKNLEYAQLTGILSEPGDRVIRFQFKTHEGPYQLVFEGIPKYPNLILTGPDGAIISALRYKNDVERPVMPQTVYAPPPRPTDRPNLWDLGEDGLRESWETAGRPPLGPWLRGSLIGTDPELDAYLAGFGDAAFAVWGQTREAVLTRGWDHFTLTPGPPPSLRVFPHPAGAGKDKTTFSTAREALEELFKLDFYYSAWFTERNKFESDLKRGVKHEERILGKLAKDRLEAERSDQYQWWGELVMAQLHRIPRHSTGTVLEDVVRGGPDPVQVVLNPEWTPLQNAQWFFKRAQKGSRGLALVNEREREIKDRIERLKSAQRSLPALKTVAEIKKARSELFPVKKAAAPKASKPRTEKVPTPNILREKLDKRFELCAGTSAAANEYVTFQLAQPDDLWFHVRDMPGSHVVLRRLQRDAQPTEEWIHKAARMAASHSKAKPGMKVTVSYTLKKHVKRIPGAPTGMVAMTHEKSLLVEV